MDARTHDRHNAITKAPWPMASGAKNCLFVWSQYCFKNTFKFGHREFKKSMLEKEKMPVISDDFSHLITTFGYYCGERSNYT